MNERLRTVAFGYGSATLVQGAVGFLAVPFLLSVMGPQAFAQWAMLEPVVAVLAGFALAGVHYGHLHGITTGLVTPGAALRQVTRFGLAPALMVALPGALAAVWFLVGAGVGPVALLCSVYVLLEAAIMLLQFQSRALSDAIAFAATVWLRSGGIALGLLAFKYAGWTLALVHYLGFMVALDITVLALALLRHRPALRAAMREAPAARAAYLDAVRYGLPIMLAAGFAMLVANGDRYVVHALMPPEQLPAYVVMAKLAGAMSFAMAPLNLWWPVVRHRHVQDSDGGVRFFANVMPLLLAYYILAAAALWLASALVVQWYAPNVHGYDPLTMLLLLVGGIALGMSAPVNIGMLAPGKTHWLLVSVAISAVVGLALAWVLVPRLGFVGAALATLLAQLASFGSVFYISQRLYPLRLDYLRLAAVAGAGGALAALLWLAAGALLAQALALAAVCAGLALILRRNVAVLTGS